ncbi:calmodulin-binding transcription activator 2 [Galendromus occidentalis]|uniref:Calmodulin-binding transcription activator 2 n=1 Tax=Galendromus occidentalis TaxID=34638 RepID=A0AAJ7L4L7_9ACAR|nr:calmodulin-binding transcription activator 2 [Galendromus occidentalis]
MPDGIEESWFVPSESSEGTRKSHLSAKSSVQVNQAVDDMKGGWEFELEEPTATCVPVLPESLETITKAESLPSQRHRWNTNEEIASILISFEKHETWLTKEVQIRPHSGSMLLYSRKRVRYRRDGYCWKKRKDGKTTREDHMKLKVQGTECIYGCYVHSAILPTFHRRCYWLLQNPDIVLVHYLNVPFSDDSKMLTAPTLSCCADAKEWTKEELMAQLKPMCKYADIDHEDIRSVKKVTSLNTVESIVCQLLEKQKEKVSSPDKGPDCPCDSTTKPSTPKSNITSHQPSIVSVHTPRSEASILQITTQTTPMSPGSTQSITVVNASNAFSQQSITAKKIATGHPVHRIISPKNLTSSTIVSALPANPVTSSTAVKTDNRLMSGPTVSNTTSNTTTSIVPSQIPIVSSAPTMPTPPRPASVLLAPCRPLNGDTSRPSFILNLSQLRGGGGLLILNGPANASNGLAGASVTPLTLVCGTNGPSPTSTVPTPATSAPIAMTEGTLTRVAVQSSANGQTISIPSPPAYPVSGISPVGTSTAPVPAGPIQRVPESTVPCSVSSSVPDYFAISPRLIQVKSENPIHVKAETPDSASPVVEAKPSPPDEDMHMDDLLPMCETNRSNSPPFPNLTPTSLQLPTGPLDISDIFNTQVQNGDFCGPKDDFMTDFGGPSVSSSDNTHTMLKTDLKTEPLDFADVPTTSLAQDLSHSSAHMAGSIGDGTVSDFNTMDFIEHNIGGSEEDGFNIETFDMLGSVATWEDLNDINALTTSQIPPPALPSSKQQNSMSAGSSPLSSDTSASLMMPPPLALPPPASDLLTTMNCDSIHRTSPTDFSAKMLCIKIVDYSPDWAYTPGGVKVLIAGDWTQSVSHFSILFDGMSVPTTLVQNGLLCCCCPSHEPGLVSLQVAVDGFVISDTVKFEYRAGERAANRASAPTDSVESNDVKKTRSCFDVEESALKYSLMERLESIEARLAISTECESPRSLLAKALAAGSWNFEQRMVSVCSGLMVSPSPPTAAAAPVKVTDSEQMSLLHLSAALGYTKLISVLLRWREENPSPLIESEVDALNRDFYENTPLHWACAKGHRKSIQQLLSWNPAAAKVFNLEGDRPGDCARNHESQGTSKQSVQIFDSKSRRAAKRPSATPLRALLSLSLKSPGDHGLCEADKNAPGSDSNGDVVDSSSKSPIVDVVSISEDEEVDDTAAVSPIGPTSSNRELLDVKGLSSKQQRVFNICLYADEEERILNLAQQIIAALPERIKSHVQDYEDEDQRTCCNSPIRLDSPIDPREEELLVEEFEASLEESTSSLFSDNLQFDLTEQNYRLTDDDPTTSLPSSSTCPRSPASDEIVEHDFSKLNLSDAEQRELYEAAITIQKAFRSYKDRKISEHQEADHKEREAAVLIQNYYRRYKQYLYHKSKSSAGYFDVPFSPDSGFPDAETSKRLKIDTKETSLSSTVEHDLDRIFGSSASTSSNIQETPSTSGVKKQPPTQKKETQAAKKIREFLRKKSQNGMATRSSWNHKPGKEERATSAAPKRQERSTPMAGASRTHMKVYGGLRSSKSQKGSRRSGAI